jgi:hypothetical protein
MNKIAKIIGWVLGLVGIALGAWCLASGDAQNAAPVDMLLRFTYFLFIAAVVILLGLTIVKSAVNDPKGLVKGLILLAVAAILVVVAYALSAGAPALNVKAQPSALWLKLTDTMLLLTVILAIGAVCAIVFGVIRNAINSK